MALNAVRISITISFAIACSMIAQSALADGKMKILAERKETVGQYLTDAAGMALYVFSKDRRGTTASKPVSNCRATCLEIWDLIEVSLPPSTGPGIDNELSGTFSVNTETVATFNGWPLYRYVVDSKPGDTEGHGVGGFGGEWKLIAPTGEPVAVQ